MAVSGDKKPVFSPAMLQFLRRRVMEISGIALILIGGAMLLALTSAGSYDPSFNRVSNAPVLNLLGVFGANICKNIRIIWLNQVFHVVTPIYFVISELSGY